MFQQHNLHENKNHIALQFEKIRQKKIIKRIEKKDLKDKYILWLVFDLIYPHWFLDVKANVIIYSDDAVTEIATQIYTPYKNEQQNIFHVSKDGIYGIPLVFDSKKQIKQINKIRVKWEILEAWEAEIRGSYLKNVVIMMDYAVNFKEGSGNFYTLHGIDTIYGELTEEAREKINIKNLDMAISQNKLLIKKKKEEEEYWEEIVAQSFNYINTKKQNKQENLTFKKLQNIKSDIEYIEDYILSVNDRNNVEKEIFYYKQKVTLNPKVVADIDSKEFFDIKKRQVKELLKGSKKNDTNV